MILILLAAVFVLITVKWGDWRNWQRYHTTILYFIFCDVLYGYLTCHYPLWIHMPDPFVRSYVGVEMLAIICFICTPLIYLGRFPNGISKSILWIGFWVIFYSLIELGLFQLGAINYYHGWRFLYSLLFNILLYTMLLLHFKHPLLTYILSVPIIMTLLYLNHVPIR